MAIDNLTDIVDSLNNAYTTLENAQYLMQELFENYFDHFDPKDAEGKTGILWEFKRHRAFAMLLSDCLFKLQNELPDLEYVNSLRAEKTVHDNGGAVRKTQQAKAVSA